MTPAIIGSISVAGAGLLLCLISIPFFIRSKNLKKNCTAKTTGKVIKYKFGGNSNAHWISPLVEFSVNGKKYKAYRHYKGVISTSVKVPGIENNLGNKDSFTITEKDMFKINTVGAFHDYKKLAEKVWPKGMELEVIYNPEKPKQAFVEKVVGVSNIAGIVLLLSGGLLIAIAGLILKIAK